ncbi:hypothetical protein Tco_0453795, partial [Tanacetum coccineum]
KLNELMELCTSLQQRVLDLETTKTTQANEIASLKRRVKKLEKKDRSRTHKLKRLYKVILSARADTDMFGVHDIVGDEVVIESKVAVKVGEKINVVEEVVAVIDVEITLAQALTESKSAKPKADKVVIHEPEHEPAMEQVKPIKRLEQMRLDEELAFNLQTEEEKQERLAREKAQQIEEANIAWDDVQAKVEADYQLAQRLQAQEQEELTNKEKARLFVQFLEQRRKYFVANRVEEKRNRPPTRAQQRNIITELVEESSKKTETELEENLKKAKAEVMEGTSKRADTELEQEVTKKQKVDDVLETAEVDNDQEVTKIKELMEIVPDKEEVSIDAIPLAVKPPSIMYLVFSHMLKSFDREDLETLWKLVKAKHGSTRQDEGYKRVLWGDLKGRIVGIKRLLDDLGDTADQVCVTAAKLKLVLFINFNEKYAK